MNINQSTERRTGVYNKIYPTSVVGTGRKTIFRSFGFLCSTVHFSHSFLPVSTMYKSRMNEWCQQRCDGMLPVYNTRDAGEGTATFISTITLPNGKGIFTGSEASNKKTAENSAAHVAYDAVHRKQTVVNPPTVPVPKPRVPPLQLASLASPVSSDSSTASSTSASSPPSSPNYTRLLKAYLRAFGSGGGVTFEPRIVKSTLPCGGLLRFGTCELKLTLRTPTCTDADITDTEIIESLAKIACASYGIVKRN